MIKDLVIRAYVFAQKAHKGQKRKFTNLPYFTHCKGVARIAEQMTKDPIIVAAGLLHDVLEDCKITHDTLSKKFGPDVAHLVLEVTNDPVLKKHFGKAVYLAEKWKCMCGKAITLKLCDRLHNVMHLENDSVPRAFAEKYVFETLHIMQELQATRLLTDVQQILFDTIMAHTKMIRVKHGI